MNLLMVRHGEIPSNVKKIYAGNSPEELTARGVIQARETAEKLKGLNEHALYSSPVKRALQTAEIIGRKIRKNVLLDDAFREMELGPWEGLSENNVARMYPMEWSIWKDRPAELELLGRETLSELLERVLTGIRNIYRYGSSRNIVVVTHVAVIRVLLLWRAKKRLNLYKTIHVPNAGVFEIGIDTRP